MDLAQKGPALLAHPNSSRTKQHEPGRRFYDGNLRKHPARSGNSGVPCSFGLVPVLVDGDKRNECMAHGPKAHWETDLPRGGTQPWAQGEEMILSVRHTHNRIFGKVGFRSSIFFSVCGGYLA